MSFDMVLTMFIAGEEAPKIDFLDKGDQGIRFAPLGSSSGMAYTADVSIWNYFGGIRQCQLDKDVLSELKLQDGEKLIITLVDSDAFNQSWSVLCKDEERQIMVLADSVEFDCPVGVELFPWQVLVGKLRGMEFFDLGFDVVDLLTGVSALVNIGYDKNHVVLLGEMGLTTNEYGLLRTVADSSYFANFASAVAVEHAPFIPVKVIANWITME